MSTVSRRLVSFAALAFVLAACRGQPGDASREESAGLTPVQFNDIPVPDGMTLRTLDAKSNSYENDGFRYGDFYYFGNLPVPEVASYMRDRMKLHGWSLVEAGDDTPATDDEVGLTFERTPYEASCRIYSESPSMTRMHVRVVTNVDKH